MGYGGREKKTVLFGVCAVAGWGWVNALVGNEDVAPPRFRNAGNEGAVPPAWWRIANRGQRGRGPSRLWTMCYNSHFKLVMEYKSVCIALQ